MARSRNIKPGFFTHDGLAELGALTRLLFVGLWTVADRAGRLEDRPRRIKAEVMPYDDCDVDEMLTALAGGGFIRRYVTESGVAAIQILAWDKHQNPHIKEAESTIQAWCEPGASTKPAGKPEQPKPEPAGLIPDSGFPQLDSKGASAFVLPEWIPEETWAAYLKTRAGKKAKNEPHALGLIVKDLDAFRAKGHDPVAVLNSSIKSGWAGVFEPKAAPGEVRTQTVPAPANADAALQKIKADDAKAAPMPAAERARWDALRRGVPRETPQGAH